MASLPTEPMQINDAIRERLDGAERKILRSDYCPYLDLKDLRNNKERWEDFNALFAKYYGMNRAVSEWKKKFFRVLHKHNSPVNAAEICHEVGHMLKGQSETIQISFISKMLSFHDESSPIYDSRVRRFFEIPQPSTKDDRVGWLVDYIDYARGSYLEWAKDQCVQEILKRFSNRDHSLKLLHDVRKLDFLVWKASPPK